MKIALILIFVCVACSHKQVSDQNVNQENSSADAVQINAQKFVLKNGLKVIISENHKLPIYSYYTFFKVGGKNEEKGITGASHFLEHLMFKGAKKYGKGKFDYLIEGSGGTTNAYTTNDNTVYYENLPASTLELVIDIESDRISNLLLDPNDFEKERAVVLEERKMRYENSPKGKMYLKMMEEMFKGSPYGTSVIGDIEDLKTVKRDQIFSYFKKYYAPNNAIIVIVGDVNTKKTIKMIEEKFGDIAYSEAVDENLENVAKMNFDIALKKSKSLYLNAPAPLPSVMLIYPGKATKDPKSVAYSVLADMIGDGKSSYLQQKYMQSFPPAVTSIYSAHYDLEKNGLIMIGADLVNNIDPKDFEKSLKATLMESCNKGLSEVSLQKTKNSLTSNIYSQLETNAGVAEFLGKSEMELGDFKKYQEELKKYHEIKLPEIKAACVEMFNQPALYIAVWKNYNK